jgi:hypothetical protein
LIKKELKRRTKNAHLDKLETLRQSSFVLSIIVVTLIILSMVRGKKRRASPPAAVDAQAAL